ncbi:Alpha-amylase [Triticum urartu]|uniref:Alpha-amylase n=1 Tax=Triticum urartu TaxID=4572 RepID=M7ZIV4_TRIUA|nr:Alpha-amylase [Triticum urartu]
MITAALPRHIAFAPVLCRPGAISIALQGVGRATARAPADCHLCHRLGSRVRGRAARRAVVVLRLREERRIGCCFGEVEDAVLAKRRVAMGDEIVIVDDEERKKCEEQPCALDGVDIASTGADVGAAVTNVAIRAKTQCCSPPREIRPAALGIARGVEEIAQAGDEDVASVRVVLMMAFGPASPAVPPPTDGHASTVRVTFVLEKKCAFGQRFLVVGDDPALGLWDPAKATALDWSEGHVWTARADLPANRLVEFKFLLQDPSGHVRWQHGGNRALQVTEASSALVVYEDWDDAGCQEVSEAALHLPIGAEGTDALLLADDGRTDVDDQATYEGFMHAEKARAAAEASLHADTMWLNGANRPQFTLQKDERIPEVLRRRANMAAAQNGGLASAGKDGDDIILYEEDANRPASMFENDMVWIRKALQGLLRNLGFHIGTTKT